MTVTESRGFFDVRTSERKVSLLPAQYDPSTPSVDGLERATNLLVPDYLTSVRLSHLPGDLYDLRPHSHLVRFIRALMGDSGAGGQRKRYLIARFQAAFTSTHFYDLDRFYGAIFGTNRLRHERLKFNPFTDNATSEEWEKIHTADARFRERVFALAKAIPMGATKPGLKTAAEAIVGAPCEVIEDWARIDYLHGHGYKTEEDFEGFTWSQIQSFGSWNQVVAQGSYADLSGVNPPILLTQREYRHFLPDGISTWDLVENIGPWGPNPLDADQANVETRRQVLPVSINDRGGVLVRPLKAYPDDERGRSEKAQDEQALRRVLNVLKPTNVKIKIDMEADGLYSEKAIAQVYSDSDYFEIVQHVSPSSLVQSSLYPLSPQQQADGMSTAQTRILPRPPFSAVQSAEWNYANEVIAVRSYAEQDTTQVVIDGEAYDRVTDIYGHVTDFSGEKGVLEPRAAEAGRLSNDTSLVNHPYASDRQVVATHG